VNAAQSAEKASQIHDVLLRRCWRWTGPPDPSGSRRGLAPHEAPHSRKSNSEYRDTTTEPDRESTEVRASHLDRRADAPLLEGGYASTTIVVLNRLDHALGRPVRRGWLSLPVRYPASLLDTFRTDLGGVDPMAVATKRTLRREVQR
jgi:hypothetical protein